MRSESAAALMSGTGRPFAANSLQLADTLADKGIPVMLNSACRRIYGNKIAAETQGSEQLIETDTVIISIGFHADMDFHHNIDREIPKNIWCIGDAKTPSNILYAVKDGNAVGRAL